MTSSKKQKITFVLFAYNQEQYIREAVMGAFSQTHQPLEIILSDDCSSDLTFAIMQEMAAAYEGPHDVRVCQTDRNLGVTPHVLLRGAEAKGEIVVVAAGDDISKPNRCSAHLPFYIDASVMAVSGSYDLIGEHSEILNLKVSAPIAKNALERQSELFEHTRFPYAVIQGSTASYRKSIFSFPLPKVSEIKFSEDNLFNFLIYAHGYQVATITEALVEYRTHAAAISNHGKRMWSISDIEVRSRDAAIKRIQKLEFFNWIAENAGEASTLNIEHIEMLARDAAVIQYWPTTSFAHRSRCLILSLISCDFAMAKWKMARLFGMFPRYQPNQLVSKLRGR